ncbi:hypothetical protein TIFTF001_009664 [Ficus carica]|uniref:Uncharacterized protein n=1 Tax=Ficus carica TaxID=3494 RepID=A0AA87ZVE2_FICCA|nr:hypothetical protein TIFTF001_009664 [Ficus carica]
MEGCRRLAGSGRFLIGDGDAGARGYSRRPLGGGRPFLIEDGDGCYRPMRSSYFLAGDCDMGARGCSRRPLGGRGGETFSCQRWRREVAGR